MKPDLLYLVHRIPYPPNKGDKIRSFHILEYLSQHYRVHLGTFVDIDEDWQYVPKVEDYCTSSCFVRLHPLQQKLLSLTGFLNANALTLPYYHNTELAGWVRDKLRTERIHRVLVFSSAMAQFVMGADYSHLRRVIDFVDMDSDKWRQYAEKKHWPLNSIYRREARRLADYEKQVTDCFDVSVFVSAAEAGTFNRLSGKYGDSITYVNNGVDTGFFSPEDNYENPFSDQEQALVFVGAMDYWANEEAVGWFANEIFPRIKIRYPSVRFYVVGARPTEGVGRLQRLPGIVVTGAVADVRPYLAHAAVVVAPLRIARGVQNKVLEAMAMARPLVGTSQAMEGIEVEPGKEVLVGDDVDTFVRRLETILGSGEQDMGSAARARVCKDFSWSSSLPRIGQLLESS